MKRTKNFWALLLLMTMYCFATKAQDTFVPAPTDGAKITFVTEFEVGEPISLAFGADEDKRNCWIDLNGNETCDAGERITEYGDMELYNKSVRNKNSRMLKKAARVKKQVFNTEQAEITVYGDLSFFWAEGAGLTDIDISGNPSLKKLSVTDNALVELNVSGNAGLTHLNADANQINSIDLSNNKKLEFVELSYNPLGVFPDMKNSSETIKIISLSFAGLTEADVTPYKNLEELYLTGNEIGKIDVSQMPKLRDLAVSFNKLSEIDVKNNKQLSKLTCDNNLLTALELAEQPNLRLLYCGDNSLKALDLTHCPKLYEFSCDGNELTALDFTNAKEVSEIYCFKNNISGKGMDDMVASLPDLHEREITEDEEINYGYLNVVCSEEGVVDNIMTRKQVRDARAKGWSVMRYNDGDFAEYEGEGEEAASMIRMKTGLEVGTPINLRITAEGDVEMEGVKYVEESQSYVVTAEEIVLKGNITELSSTDNTYQGNVGIKELDLSQCPGLKSLVVWGNSLKELDLTNSDNLQIVDVSLNKLKKLKINRNNMLQELNCAYNSLTQIDLSGSANLYELSCYQNKLTEVSVSGCSSLEELRCEINSITELDVSDCSKLYSLNCRENKLTKLDVSGCPSLEKLLCSKNKLEKLDVSFCQMLDYLDCTENQLEELDVSHNDNLSKLFCYMNGLRKLELGDGAMLKSVFCNKNMLEELHVANMAVLEEVGCSDNMIKSLDLTGCPSLKNLSIYSNQINEKNMDALVSSMPSRVGSEPAGTITVVNDPPEDDGNVFTKKHVGIANNLNWEVYIMTFEGRELYEGSVETGIGAVSEDGFKFYPNPATDYINIANAAPDTDVALLTVGGIRVARTRTDMNGAATMDVSAQPSGNYLLQVGNKAYHVVVK
ncbi:T9SS type A sorting domain-containing protein [Prevotella dentasini]